MRRAPSVFAQVFTDCFKGGFFPAGRKLQQLLLIRNSGRPIGQLTSCRPIDHPIVLNTIGNGLKRIICNRLHLVIDSGDYISSRQFGFRKARPAVFELAREIFGEGKCLAPVTFFIKKPIQFCQTEPFYQRQTI